MSEGAYYAQELDYMAKVKKLHSKETRYMVDAYDDMSWESLEDLHDWFPEDEQPTAESISTFDVCAECARAEWINSDFNYIGDNSAWPCPTARIWEGSE